MVRGGTLLAVALALALSPGVASGQAPTQPDLGIVSRGGAFLVGEDVHNADGVGQQRSLIAGRHATLDIVLENEGAHAASFVIRGSAAEPGFHVTYHRVRRSGVRDLTSRVVGEGLTWTIDRHARRSFTVFVDADPTTALGAVQSLLITATSTTNAAATDAVRATITNVSTPIE